MRAEGQLALNSENFEELIGLGDSCTEPAAGATSAGRSVMRGVLRDAGAWVGWRHYGNRASLADKMRSEAGLTAGDCQGTGAYLEAGRHGDMASWGTW